jgi:ATP-dependent Clp protease ATP-binding subunit ClpA
MRIWSPQAMEIMNMAQKKASAMKHAELDPLHLLWAFLREATQPGENETRAGWEADLAVHKAERELAVLPRARKTLIASPNTALRALILRAADLAAASNSRKEEGRLGPHELVLALVADTGPAGEMLRSFKMKPVPMAG